MHISRRGTLFGLLAFAGAGPAPGFAEAFDHSSVDDIGAAPARRLALFGARERVIGRPAELFPRAAAAKKAKPREDRAWLETLHGLHPFGAKGQIAGVNSYVNGAARIGAIAALGRAAPWASPLAYFHSDGASEDYAAAKFVSLRRLGFHPDRLRIVWVADLAEGGRRAVLTVGLGAQAAVLEQRTSTITTDAMLTGYRPYCSLGESRFSLHWDPAEGRGVMASLDRLGKSLRAATA